MRTLCGFSVSVAVAGLFASWSSVADGVSDLDDAVARMQYAYFTAEPRSVQDALAIVQKVQLPASMHGMKEYFTAYGQWKLAELHTDEAAAGRREARGAASKAAGACVKAAEEAQRLDGRFGEPFALEAICSSLASRTSDGCAKNKELRTALELTPSNPRVLLIDAHCAAAADKPDSAATVERLRGVVQAFEAAPPSRPGRPDWGQPEALLMLGQAYLQRGDALAARDVIERALVIAPDYRKARDALEKAATRPR